MLQSFINCLPASGRKGSWRELYNSQLAAGLGNFFSYVFVVCFLQNLKKYFSNGNKMPTATDVDNRPLAIGKWPRLRRNNQNALRRPRTAHLDSSDEGRGTVRQYHHRDWCTLDDCVHSCDEGSNICTDILLQPELLQEFYGDRGQ
jgi:hypothetical protein